MELLKSSFTSVLHIFLTSCKTSYSASSSLVVLVGVVCWGMRTNSFIAVYTDVVGERKDDGVNAVFVCFSFSWMRNLSVRVLTCPGGFEAYNKRLPGEGINIAWFNIWILILVNECHCVSPAHHQRHSAAPALVSVKKLAHQVWKSDMSMDTGSSAHL